MRLYSTFNYEYKIKKELLNIYIKQFGSFKKEKKKDTENYNYSILVINILYYILIDKKL